MLLKAPEPKTPGPVQVRSPITGTRSLSQGILRVGVSGSSSKESAIDAYTRGLLEGASSAGLPLSFEWLVERLPNGEGLPPNVHAKKSWTKGPLALFQIWKAARASRLKVIHLQYEYFLYAERISAFFIPLSLFLLKLVGGLKTVRVVLTLHEVVPLSSIGPSLYSRFFIRRVPSVLVKGSMILTNRLLAFSADVLIVHLQSFASILSNDYGISPSKISVIPHGVTRRGVPSSPGRDIIFFGFVTPNKGIETLVEAFGDISVPGVKLMLVGGRHRRDDGYFERIRALASRSPKAGLISLTGYVGEERLTRLFQDAAVVVLPYKTSFSASGALAYAMSYEKPVIVPPLDPFKESLADSGIYAEADRTQLAPAITQVLAKREYAEAYSEKIRARADRMSWSNCARMTMDVYLRLLDTPYD